MRRAPTLLPLLIVWVVSISGCASDLRVRQDAEELAGIVDELHNPDFLQRRNRATEALRKKINKTAPWLRDAFSASYREAPATHVIRAVLGEHLTVFQLSEAAGDPKVKAPMGATTIGGHLDAIAAQTNWHYHIADGIVYWNDVPTKVFKIAFPQGTWQSQLGRESRGESDSTLDSAGQHAFLQRRVDLWAELGESLKSMLGGHAFTLLPSINSVTVTAPPNYLRQVEQVIARFNRSASQRVLVELEIYLVDLSDSDQQTIDWSFVRKASSARNLSIAQKGGSLLESLNPFTVSLADESDGKHSGSNFIFSALSQQGAATVVSHPKIICLNNQVSELRLTRVTPYTSEVSYQAEQNIVSSRLRPNINTDQVVSGTTIYVLPAINGRQVNLSLSVNYTQINRFLNQSFGEEGSSINVQLPEYDDTHFTLPVVLGSGETMVLAGNPRSVSDAQDSGNRIPLLGRRRSNNQRRTETVMLLTVHVLDPA
jgi:type IVB pilus formation R64 PilN family outer membrane protein